MSNAAYIVPFKQNFIGTQDVTGTYQVELGNNKRISDKLARVIALLVTKKNSVPNTTFYQCGLRDIKKGGKFLAQRVVAEVDKALRPWKNILYNSYERSCWTSIDGRSASLKITIENGDLIEKVTIPILVER